MKFALFYEISVPRHEDAGCDLLFCIVNPYKIPHEQVMESIELIGAQVIPQFADR